MFVRRNGRQIWLDKGNVRMLFYTTIFVASLIGAVVILWLYRLISGAARAIHKTTLPRSDTGPTSHLETSPVRNGSTPRDLKNQHVPEMLLAREYAGRPKVEPKFAGDNSYYGPHDQYSALTYTNAWMPSADWIHREDKTALIGNTYKVTRKAKTREKNPKIVSRPSSW